MDFEEAKAKWLEKMGGKSIEEFEEDKERKLLKSFDELDSDPETEKIWAQAEKESDEGDDS